MQHLGGPGYQGGGPPPTNRACREFSSTGRCKWGPNCRFSHDAGPGPQDMLRGPPTHRGNVCSQWASTGRCTYGDSCKFAHPEQPMQQFAGPSIPQQQQQQPAQLQAPQIQQYGGMSQLPPPPQQQLAQQQRPPSSGDSGQQQQQPPLRQYGSKPPTPGHTPAHQQQLEPTVQPSPQIQQQQQGPPPAYCYPKPGKPTYVDCVRAICEALNIGRCGDMVTDETRAAAMRSFNNRSLFRESRFADSVEQYLPG